MDSDKLDSFHSAESVSHGKAPPPAGNTPGEFLSHPLLPAPPVGGFPTECLSHRTAPSLVPHSIAPPPPPLGESPDECLSHDKTPPVGDFPGEFLSYHTVPYPLAHGKTPPVAGAAAEAAAFEETQVVTAGKAERPAPPAAATAAASPGEGDEGECFWEDLGGGGGPEEMKRKRDGKDARGVVGAGGEGERGVGGVMEKRGDEEWGRKRGGRRLGVGAPAAAAAAAAATAWRVPNQGRGPACSFQAASEAVHHSRPAHPLVGAPAAHEGSSALVAVTPHAALVGAPAAPASQDGDRQLSSPDGGAPADGGFKHSPQILAHTSGETWARGGATGGGGGTGTGGFLASPQGDNGDRQMSSPHGFQQHSSPQMSPRGPEEPWGRERARDGGGGERGGLLTSPQEDHERHHGFFEQGFRDSQPMFPYSFAECWDAEGARSGGGGGRGGSGWEIQEEHGGSGGMLEMFFWGVGRALGRIFGFPGETHREREQQNSTRFGGRGSRRGVAAAAAAPARPVGTAPAPRFDRSLPPYTMHRSQANVFLDSAAFAVPPPPPHASGYRQSAGYTPGGYHQVVNAANESVLGGGGVDGAIHRAAGPTLLKLCRDLPRLRNGDRCETGDAVTTGAARLPVRHVIHAVGPVYWNDRKSAPVLKETYRSILREASNCRVKYIAIPAISCGIFGYPPVKGAQASLDVLLSQSWGSVQEVHFVLFDQWMLNVWLNVIHAANLPQLLLQRPPPPQQPPLMPPQQQPPHHLPPQQVQPQQQVYESAQQRPQQAGNEVTGEGENVKQQQVVQVG
ncbi:unnamed protein product [Closterium sp. Naga37s-1]|nr:unnamed protein product [Closterium sp. Naga37s-1]